MADPIPTTFDTPPPAAPPTVFDKLVRIADSTSPLTRNAIALSLVYAFIHLAFLKEVSGDSVTNVIFVVMGYFFGRDHTTSMLPKGFLPPNGNGAGDNGAPPVPPKA